MRADTEKLPGLIDTNVLVYAYAEESKNTPNVLGMLNDCFVGKARLAVSLQNIGEFCFVALRKYRLDPAVVHNICTHLLVCRTLIKVKYSGTTLLNATTISAASKLEFWDAVLVATMKENAIETIYTEDDSFAKVEGIKAVNPFLKE